jgi:hypothetical protein
MTLAASCYAIKVIKIHTNSRVICMFIPRRKLLLKFFQIKACLQHSIGKGLKVQKTVMTHQKAEHRTNSIELTRQVC